MWQLIYDNVVAEMGKKKNCGNRVAKNWRERIVWIKKIF